MSFLIGILVSIIYILFLHLVEKHYIKCIESSASSTYRIKIRRKLRIIRNLSFLILAAFLSFSPNGEFSPDGFGGICNALYYLSRRTRYSLQISTNVFEDIKDKKDSFMLYLRGFSSDDYNPIKKIKNNYEQFHEYHLIYEIRHYIEVFSIGKTREIESPDGATRVYLESKEWKKQVKYLMEISKANIIHLNSSSNCIWEIEQSSMSLSKNIYIVSDYDEFKKVQNELRGKFFIPLIDKYKTPFCFMFRNGQINIFPIELSTLGYKQTVGMIMEGAFNLTRHETSEEKGKNYSKIIVSLLLWCWIFPVTLNSIYNMNEWLRLIIAILIYTTFAICYFKIKKKRTINWSTKYHELISNKQSYKKS